MKSMGHFKRSTYQHGAMAAVLGAAVLVASVTTIASNAAKSNVLATADQHTVEALAIKLASTPEVKQEKAATEKWFAADQTAQSEDGKKTLHNAVEELAFSAALGAANSDPARPKLVWAYTAPRTWLGHTVPGSRWGIDNPDNVYRFVTVDGASRYEITGHTRQAGPVQFSFLLYDTYIGENTKQKTLDEPIGGLRDRDIQIAADGSFKITLDSNPANGRVNHIQSNSDAKILLVRNTFSDWSKQSPLEVEVRRVGGPAAAQPVSEAELVKRTVEYIRVGAPTLLRLKNGGLAANGQPNKLSTPKARGGGWGFASFGTFKLAKDEALLLTLEPLGARYLSVDLTDPWLVSLEHIRASGNLNNGAAQVNRDGSITYLISSKDPGIQNWLATSGVREGSILIRWQALPESVKSADAAVREVKVVKLGQLAEVLPAETSKVTPDQRKQQFEVRASNYARRYLQ